MGIKNRDEIQVTQIQLYLISGLVYKNFNFFGKPHHKGGYSKSRQLTT